MILLDASDPELHRIAAPIYSAAIERAAELDDALLARGRELEAAGYHQQVKVTPSSTLLFTLRDGARVPVHRQSNASGANFVVRFLDRDETIPEAEMLRRLPPSLSSSAPTYCSGRSCRITFCPRWLTWAGPRKSRISARARWSIKRCWDGLRQFFHAFPQPS